MIKCTKCLIFKNDNCFGKHCDGSQRRYCNDCHLLKRRENYKKTSDSRNEKLRKRYREDESFKNKCKQRNRKEYKVNGRKSLKEWEEKNKYKVMSKQRIKMRRRTRNITDGYVRKLLAQHANGINTAIIPKYLIELKREHIILMREINEKRK